MQRSSGLKIKIYSSGITKDMISVAYFAVLSSYRKFGIPKHWVNGPVEFLSRPDSEEANGRFDNKTNVVKIFIPQETHVAVDLTWSIAHEIGHRIWHRVLSKASKDSWNSMFKTLGNSFSSEAIRARLTAAISDKHDPFWFWFKKNLGDRPSDYPKYLSKIKYIANLPRDYASNSSEEAWADVVANLVLGRSRNGSLMRKSSNAKQFAIKLLDFEKSQSECCEITKEPNMMRGTLFGDRPRRTILLDTKPGIESFGGSVKIKRSGLITTESVFTRSHLVILEAENIPSDPLQTQELQGQGAPSEPQQSQQVPQQVPQQVNIIIPVNKISETSPEFDAQISNALLGISEEVRQLLSDAGFTVATSSTFSDAIGQLANQSSLIPWTAITSAALLETKQIVVAESTVDATGNPSPGLNPEGMLRHSIGHALDSLAPQFASTQHKNNFSDLDGFKYAHTSDLARLGADKKQKLAYYVDDLNTAKSECFAECFAAMSGGGSVYTVDVMSKYFPAVVKQVKDVLTALQSGRSVEDTQEEPVQEPQDAPAESTEAAETPTNSSPEMQA